MSNDSVIVGKVLRAELAENAGTNELVAKLAHNSGEARVLIVQHGHKMETDLAYREAWERLIKVLSEKSGDRQQRPPRRRNQSIPGQGPLMARPRRDFRR